MTGYWVGGQSRVRNRGLEVRWRVREGVEVGDGSGIGRGVRGVKVRGVLEGKGQGGGLGIETGTRMKSRSKPNKKRRILLRERGRKMLRVRMEAGVREKEDREKRAKRNREKKVKRKVREKAKKGVARLGGDQLPVD